MLGYLGQKENSWLYRSSEEFDRGDVDDLKASSIYICALYWMMDTASTRGNGDFVVSTEQEMVLFIFLLTFSTLIYGSIISITTALLLSSDTLWNEHNRRVQRLKTFMQQHKMNEKLQRMMTMWMEYQWATDKGIDENEFLEAMPSTLKQQVTLSVAKHVIDATPLFRGVEARLAAAIMELLAVKTFVPGDVIVRADTLGDEMFIVDNGSVGVMGADERTVIARLEPGAFFGELAVLLAGRRTRSVVALTYCKLYVLKHETLEKVFQMHPVCIDNLCKNISATYDIPSVEAQMRSFEKNLMSGREPSTRHSSCTRRGGSNRGPVS